MRTDSELFAAHMCGWDQAALASAAPIDTTAEAAGLCRRTVLQGIGVLTAAAFLSAVPIVAVANLLLHPPKGTMVGGFVIASKIAWQWPIYGTLVASIVAVALSVRFGGRIDDIKVSRGTSKGQHLH